MQVDTLLNGLLLSGSGRLYGILIGAVLDSQTRDGIPGQVSLVFEITIGDLFSFSMCVQPAVAVSQQLFDFVMPYAVVFLVVMPGDQRLGMRRHARHMGVRIKRE